MRVAVVATIRDFPWGAPGACLASLADELLAAGHQVLLVLAPMDLEHPEVARLAKVGASIETLPPPAPVYVRLRRVRDAIRRRSERSLARILHAWRADHVYFNQGGTYSALSREFEEATESFGGRYSLICHLNHVQAPFGKTELARARSLMRNARRVYFSSRQNLELAELQIAEAIPNAAQFHYPLRFAPEALAWPQASIARLAMVCRLDVFHKGIDLALPALAQLRDRGAAFHLTIYGEGADDNYIRELRHHLRLERDVTLAGFAADIRTVWVDEELLLLPSRHEGCSVAMTEAMALGRPVLATACGGAMEWVADGINGYMCPAGDAPALANTLNHALADRARWRQLGLRAHQDVLSRRPQQPARALLQSLQPEAMEAAVP